MATVNGGPLSFEAVIDDTAFNQSIDNMANKAMRFAQAQNEAAEKAINDQKALARQIVESGQSFDVIRKSILQLEIALQSYQAIARKSTDPKQIAEYNRKIEETQQKIEQLGRIGKAGFDAIGRPMRDQMGILKQLQQAAALYQQAIDNATNEADIVKYNRKLQETNNEIQRLTNAGKTGFDAMGNAMQKTDSYGARLRMTMLSIAGALGFVGLITSAVELAKELFSVAKEAEGVELAFSRIGSAAQLEELRRQTRGTVSDLELMKSAVKASNFKIPMDVLGKGLAFAQQRAKDTGQSVDYLVDSFVTGLGRKSTMILDNLGISLIEIQKEVQKTGDFNIAVGNIIEREMAKSGEAVDTLGEKTGGMAATWDNAKKSVAGFFRELLNPGAMDVGKVTELTDQLATELGATMDRINKLTNPQLEMIAIRLQAQKEALKEEREKLDKELVEAMGRAGNNQGLIADITRRKKAIDEEAQATQNVLTNVLKQNDALAEQRRIGADILSITEMQEKVERLRTEALNKIPTDAFQVSERERLLKEAEDLQTEIDKILDRKKKERKAKTDTYDEAEAHRNMMEKIAEVDREYTRKSLTQNEAEIQAVRDKFKKIAYEVEQYNRNKKNTIKIDVEVLEPIRDRAISDLLYKQETEALKVSLDQQKQLYNDFEAYRKIVGEEAAEERYGKEIDVAKTYMDRLKEELAGLRAIPADQLTGIQQERYIELLKREATEEKRLQAERDKNYAEALNATATFEQKRLAIMEKFARMRGELEANPNTPDYDARMAELERQQAAELDLIKGQVYEKSEAYRELNEQIVAYSRRELKTRIALLKDVLEGADISDEFRKKIEADLAKAEAAIGKSRNRQVKQALQTELRGLQEQLMNNPLTSDAQKAAMIARIQEIKAELASMAGKQFAEISKYAQVAQASFAELADAVKSSNPELSKMLGKMSEIAGVAGNAAGAVASFASGDIAGGITQSIGAITGIIKMFDKSAERQANLEKERQAAMEATSRALEEMNRQLERQQKLIERALGNDKIDAYRKLIQLLNSDIAETADKFAELDLKLTTTFAQSGRKITTDYDVIFKKLGDVLYDRPDRTGRTGDKGKLLDTIEEVAEANRLQLEELYKLLEQGSLSGDIEGLKQLMAHYEELQDQLYDYKRQIQETLTGTSFSGLTDQIVRMFAEGKVAAADFAETFRRLMEQAIITSFQRNAIEKQMQVFYDAFAAAVDSGNELTEVEIFTLQDMYNTILEDARKEFERLQKIAGITKTEASGTDINNNALAGAIRGMTESTAELLAGQFNAMRIHVANIEAAVTGGSRAGNDPVLLAAITQHNLTIESNRIALVSMQHLARIEANTAAMAASSAVISQRAAEMVTLGNDQVKSLKAIDRKTPHWTEVLGGNGWKV